MDPNLKDPIVKLMYNATIEKHKPKLDSKNPKNCCPLMMVGVVIGLINLTDGLKENLIKKVKNLFIQTKIYKYFI